MDNKELKNIKDKLKKCEMEEELKEDLLYVIGNLSKKKKFGLVWEYKTEDLIDRCKREAPILKRIKKNMIKTDESEQNNVLIEGDNYHALQVLNYTHKGLVDFIYIDPPYNTGNSGWLYDDKIVESTDVYKHSKWLAMMDKRLRLAKNLLSKKGVVFISIDDNEQANLKLLCDEIFGEVNVEKMVWHKVGGGDASDGKMKITYRFRREHENIIVCYKNKGSSRFNKTLELPDFKNAYTNPDKDPRGEYKQGIISKTELKSKMTGKNYYSIKTPGGKTVTRQWLISREEFAKKDADNRIYYGKSGNSIPSIKIFINEYKPTTPTSIITNKGSSRLASKALSEMGIDFPNPKPVSLIKYLLKIGSSHDSITLDFFAGSGTTGHAVLELNREDGGKRSFILCTNNEGKIAEKITYPRIKKAIKGYKKIEDKNGKREKIEGLGGNLEYLKTEFVNVDNINRVTDRKRLEFTHLAGEVIALKEGCFQEVVKNKHYQVFTNGKDKYVGIYFRENIEKLSELEDKILDKGEIKLYIFSFGGASAWKSNYEDYDNVIVEDVPEPILKVYKNLNR